MAHSQVTGVFSKWQSYLLKDNPRAYCNPEGAQFECPHNPYACLGLSIDADDSAVNLDFPPSVIHDSHSQKDAAQRGSIGPESLHINEVGSCVKNVGWASGESSFEVQTSTG